MSKSIEQVWREMQQRRQAEIQRQATLERQINEERERARREYVQKMRMNERSVSVAAAAASAAAGAAGGAGGGSKKQAEVTPSISINGQAELFYDSAAEFKYFIYNFETSTITPIFTLPVIGFPSNAQPVTNAGFYLQFYDGNTNTKIFYFIDINGNVVFQDTVDDAAYYDLESFSKYVAVYYYTGVNYRLVVFKPDFQILSYNFDYLIEGGGYSYDDVHKAGFIVKETNNNIIKFYLVEENGTSPVLFKEFDDDLGDIFIYQYAFSEKILCVFEDLSNTTYWEIYDTSGILITNWESTIVSNNFNIYDTAFLNENGGFVSRCYDGENNNWVILYFSGVTDTFSWKSFDGNYDLEFDIQNQRNYRFLSNFDAEGSCLFYFYPDYYSGTVINNYRYNELAAFLPIWSTDTELRDFFTFSFELGIFGAVDSNNIALIRNSDYICVIADTQPYGLYNFSDQGMNSISDGGEDMYDGGNILYADNVVIDYTHSQCKKTWQQGLEPEDYCSDGLIISGASAAVFGLSSSPSYFTNMYPGLFVMCAEGTSIDEFKINGDTGQDGSGTQESYTYQKVNLGVTYQVFVKRSFGAADIANDSAEPSINQIIIVNAATSSGITQTIGGSTDSDLHSLSGLFGAGVNTIYYLLSSLSFGGKMSDEQISQLVDNFFTLRSNLTFTNLLTTLNNNYSSITADLPQRQSRILRFNREGDYSVVLEDEIPRNLADGDDDVTIDKAYLYFNTRANGRYGWDKESNLEYLNKRRFSGFYQATNYSIGNVVGQEFVMLDVANDNYWAIQFSEYSSDGSGQFAYTRQLIQNGSLTGSVISFTHSAFGSEIDIISAGVLEITRNAGTNLIYNAAFETDSNDNTPYGTLWNSERTYDYDDTKWIVLGKDGGLIDTLYTTNEISSDFMGHTYFIRDNTLQKSFISNKSNDGQFTTLNLSYPGQTFQNDYITENNLRSSKMLRTNVDYDGKVRFRALTEDSISEEFEFLTVEEFSKLVGSSIGETGIILTFIDAFKYNFLFYNLSGELILNKEFYSEGGLPSIDWDIISRGKRQCLVYSDPFDNNIRKIIFFDGTNIFEYNTGLSNQINYESNDWLVEF